MQRFELQQEDREALGGLRRGGRESVRVVKRARLLQLLHEGWTLAEAANASGVAENTAQLVRRRYLTTGPIDMRKSIDSLMAFGANLVG